MAVITTEELRAIDEADARARVKRFLAGFPLSPRLFLLLLLILITMGPLGLVLEAHHMFDGRPLLANYWSGLVGSSFAIPVLAWLLDGSRTRQALRAWRRVHLEVATALDESVYEVTRELGRLEGAEVLAPEAPWAELHKRGLRPIVVRDNEPLIRLTNASVALGASPVKSRNGPRALDLSNAINRLNTAVTEATDTLADSPLRQAVAPVLRSAKAAVSRARPRPFDAGDGSATIIGVEVGPADVQGMLEAIADVDEVIRALMDHLPPLKQWRD